MQVQIDEVALISDAVDELDVTARDVGESCMSPTLGVLGLQPNKP